MIFVARQMEQNSSVKIQSKAKNQKFQIKKNPNPFEGRKESGRDKEKK